MRMYTHSKDAYFFYKEYDSTGLYKNPYGTLGVCCSAYIYAFCNYNKLYIQFHFVHRVINKIAIDRFSVICLTSSSYFSINQLQLDRLRWHGDQMQNHLDPVLILALNLEVFNDLRQRK